MCRGSVSASALDRDSISWLLFLWLFLCGWNRDRERERQRLGSVNSSVWSLESLVIVRRVCFCGMAALFSFVFCWYFAGMCWLSCSRARLRGCLLAVWCLARISGEVSGGDAFLVYHRWVYKFKCMIFRVSPAMGLFFFMVVSPCVCCWFRVCRAWLVIFGSDVILLLLCWFGLPPAAVLFLFTVVQLLPFIGGSATCEFGWLWNMWVPRALSVVGFVSWVAVQYRVGMCTTGFDVWFWKAVGWTFPLKVVQKDVLCLQQSWLARWELGLNVGPSIF